MVRETVREYCDNETGSAVAGGMYGETSLVPSPFHCLVLDRMPKTEGEGLSHMCDIR